jgi:hypothetical protein
LSLRNNGRPQTVEYYDLLNRNPVVRSGKPLKVGAIARKNVVQSAASSSN